MDNLGGFLRYPIQEIPFVILVLMIAFTLHEFAHAFLADRFGDPTPRSMGRVTLNPRVHLDVLGTVLIFFVGFGWAKPVMIRSSNFKKPRLMGIIVSLAGPVANLLIAFIGLLILYILAYFKIFEMMSPGVFNAVITFIRYLLSLNMMLFIFNLLPLPPLDGYRILQDFLPLRARLKVQEYEQWAIYLFLLFVVFPPLNRAILGPVFALSNPILDAFNSLLIVIFGDLGIFKIR